MEYLDLMKSGVPSLERTITLAGASYPDDIVVDDRRVVRLLANAAGIRYKFSRDCLKDGEFLNPATWVTEYDADLRPSAPAEGALLRKGGPWIEQTTSGKVTLNKVSPLYNDQDLELDLDTATTRLQQLGWYKLRVHAHILRFYHLESDAAETLDYAVIKAGSTGATEYLQGGGTFSTSENWFTASHSLTLAGVTQAFTPDEEGYYGVRFRPSSAQTGVAQLSRVYIAEDADASDPELPNGEPVYVVAQGRGRIVLFGTSGDVSIAEMQ